MTMEERQRLIDTLNDTYSKLLTLIDDIDPETQVNPETDWRIRDIVGHLAVWDREVARSIRAFQSGAEYTIPNFDEDGFNKHELQEQRKRSNEEVFALWEQERGELLPQLKICHRINSMQNSFIHGATSMEA